MSIVVNMVGGGGGGSLSASDAILCVTVPTGSSVTATKSGTTLTPTIWTRSADNTLDMALFSIPSSTFDANAWTVTATLNGNTKSDTIVIDTAAEYDIELTYIQYYYNLGDVMSSVTGGYSRTSTAGTLTFNDDNMQWVAGSNTERFAASENAVNLTSYNTLYFNVYCNSSYAKKVGVASSRGTTFVSSVSLTQGSTYTLVSIDISSLTGSYYIMFSNGSSNATGATRINAIYAE